MEGKIIAMVLSLLILLQAGLLRAYVGIWIVPGCIFGFLSLVALWSVPIDPQGIVYLLVVCILLALPAYFFGWRDALRLRQARPLISLFVWPSSLASVFVRAAILAVHNIYVATREAGRRRMPPANNAHVSSDPSMFEEAPMFPEGLAR